MVHTCKPSCGWGTTESDASLVYIGSSGPARATWMLYAIPTPKGLGAASRVAHWVNLPAVKPENLGLIPRPPGVGEEDQLPEVSL